MQLARALAFTQYGSAPGRAAVRCSTPGARRPVPESGHMRVSVRESGHMRVRRTHFSEIRHQYTHLSEIRHPAERYAQAASASSSEKDPS